MDNPNATTLVPALVAVYAAAQALTDANRATIPAARRQLEHALTTARNALMAAVTQRAPQLRSYLKMPPECDRGRAREVAQQAQCWCRDAPGVAASRISEVYGVGAGSEWLVSLGLAPRGGVEARATAQLARSLGAVFQHS